MEIDLSFLEDRIMFNQYYSSFLFNLYITIIKMSGWFKIEGLDEAANYIDNMAKTLRQQVTDQIVPVMKQGADRITRDSPVRTGQLKRSVRFEMGGSGKGMLCQIHISAPYAGFVEFGAMGRPPRNFVTPNYNWIVSQLKSR